MEQLDLAGLNLRPEDGLSTPTADEPPPKIAMAREKLIEEAKKMLENKDEKKGVSLVVIGRFLATCGRVYAHILTPTAWRKGHVDAGKSTLMGRLLYELGKMDEKKRLANERASSKVGKSSFSWAWEFDGTTEERER